MIKVWKKVTIKNKKKNQSVCFLQTNNKSN